MKSNTISINVISEEKPPTGVTKNTALLMLGLVTLTAFGLLVWKEGSK